MAIYLTDNFDRADSNTVGDSWTELNDGSGAELAIVSNVFKMTAGTTANNKWIYKSHGALTLPVTLRARISAGNRAGNNMAFWLGIYGSTSQLGNMVGIRVYPGQNTTHNFYVSGSTTNFSYDWTTYEKYIWLDYTANGSNVDVALYISDTEEKPGSATATILNQTIPGDSTVHVGFTPASTTGSTLSVDWTILETLVSPSSVTIFSDDFNRTNSATVGNGWTEHQSTNATVEISSNQLVSTHSSTSLATEAWCHQSHGSITLPVSLSFNVGSDTTTQSNNYYLIAGIYGDGSTYSNFLGLRARPSQSGSVHEIMVNGTGTAFSYDWATGGQARYVWIDYIANSSNVDINVYISTTSTKPSSATASLTNQTIPAQSNMHFGMFINNAAGTADVLALDNFLLEKTPANATVSVISLSGAMQTNVATGGALIVASVISLVSAMQTAVATGAANAIATVISLTTAVKDSLSFVIGWLGQSKNSTSFSNQSKNSTSFANQSKNSTNYTNQTKNTV